MNLGNLFSYFALATGGVTAVVTIQHLVSDGIVTGPELMAAIEPALQALRIIFPKLKIPVDLLTNISNVVADAINIYYKKV